MTLTGRGEIIRDNVRSSHETAQPRDAYAVAYRMPAGMYVHSGSAA
jgi:hypothetical protein